MMDTKKATALHHYYLFIRRFTSIASARSVLATWTGLAFYAMDNGADDNELSAIEAIAGCDWAPEWAKERYTT